MKAIFEKEKKKKFNVKNFTFRPIIFKQEAPLILKTCNEESIMKFSQYSSLLI